MSKPRTQVQNHPLLTLRSVDSESPLMKASDVAVYLQLPAKKVYEVVGSIALSLGARRLRWRKSDLDSWLDAHRRK